MPRVIFKCPYIKPGTKKAAAHLNNYVRYAATREGVDKLAPDKSAQPATDKQQAIIQQLVRDFPLSRGMFEYEDYLAAPTFGAASEFISRAIEDYWVPAEAQRSGFGGERSHSGMSELSPQGGSEGYEACGDDDQIAKRENYVSYIAKRPRAERVGSHGLFNGTGDEIVLSNVADEVANHTGNVWLPIISLHREDAARLGYDNAKQWQALLSSYALQMANAMKIPWEQFHWYAAFHDEGHHPHVHMVCYSADGKSGFLDKAGIEKIKSGIAKEVFRQDLTELYCQQTIRRDELIEKSGEVMGELIAQMQTGTLDNPRIEQLMDDLSRKLKNTGGKKQYGYLKANVKSIVDEIVDELAKEPHVAAAYELWYLLREKVLRTYKDELPERLPLSQQKEFKRVKNLVIDEAVRLGEYSEVFAAGDDSQPEAENNEGPHSEGTDSEQKYSYAQYCAAKQILADPSSTQQQTSKAMEWLTKLADAGLDCAQYTLGKLYRDGGIVEPDKLRAVIWFTQVAEQGNEYAMYALGKMHQDENNLIAAMSWFRRSAELGNSYAQYRLGKLLLNGEGAERDAKDALRWLAESANRGNQYAQYALGKLYLTGKYVSQNKDTAVRWFSMAADQGNEYAQYFLDHLNASPALLTNATRLLRHMGNIFREQAPPPAGSICFVDSKLRRKMQEKKVAMGHKRDDHEDKTQQMQ